MKALMHKCPDCGAEEGKPCTTPTGGKMKSVHSLRPMSLVDVHMPSKLEIEKESKEIDKFLAKMYAFEKDLFEEYK